MKATLAGLLLLAAIAWPSCAALGQLVCVPGNPIAALEPVCRPMEDKDKHCRGGKLTNCLIDCFGPGIDDVLTTRKCESCPTQPNPTAGDMVSVPYELIPHNFYHFNISFHLPCNVFGQFKVQYGKVCRCTGEGIYNINITDDYSHDLSSNKWMEVAVEYSGKSVSKSILHPRHCADNERGVPYDRETCGLPQLQKPLDVSFQCNDTHTNISWNTATSYIIPGSNQSVSVNSTTFYLTVNITNGSIFHFVAFSTSKVTLNTTAAMTVSLYSYMKCSGLYTFYDIGSLPAVGCSKPTIVTNTGTCCRFSPCSTPPLITELSTYVLSPTTLSSKPQEADDFTSQVLIITLPLIVVAVLVAVGVIAILIRVRICRPNPKQVLPSPLQYSALVVYSPATPEKERLAIVNSFAAVRNIFLQDMRKPQETLVSWILEHYEKANTVLCVCNKQFMCDWETYQTSEGSPVAVQTLRMLFEGDIGSANHRKYAVVLSCPSDKVFIPTPLKTLPRINMSDTPALMNFTA